MKNTQTQNTKNSSLQKRNYTRFAQKNQTNCQIIEITPDTLDGSIKNQNQGIKIKKPRCPIDTSQFQNQRSQSGDLRKQMGKLRIEIKDMRRSNSQRTSRESQADVKKQILAETRLDPRDPILNGVNNFRFKAGSSLIRQSLEDFAKVNRLSRHIKASLNFKANLIFCKFLSALAQKKRNLGMTNIDIENVEKFSPMACLLIAVKIESQVLAHNFSIFLKKKKWIRKKPQTQKNNNKQPKEYNQKEATPKSRFQKKNHPKKYNGALASVEKQILFTLDFQFPKYCLLEHFLQLLDQFEEKFAETVEQLPRYDYLSNMNTFRNFLNTLNLKVTDFFFNRALSDQKIILLKPDEIAKLCFEEIRMKVQADAKKLKDFYPNRTDSLYWLNLFLSEIESFSSAKFDN